MATELRCKVPVGMVEALRDAGLSHTEVLATARLPLRLLDIPGPRVSVPDYFALWHAIETVSGDPSIGIVLATLVRPDITEPLFLAVLSAVDVAGAIDTVSRYKRIMEPQDLVVRSDEGTGQVTLTLPDPECHAIQPQILVDAQLAFILEMCRRGTSHRDLKARELHLRRPTLDPNAKHAGFFGCEIQLGAQSNSMVLAAEDVARPFVTHNPHLLSALIPYLKANTPTSSTSAVARVRMVIGDRVRGRRPTLRTVGRELAMSSRALQRVLRDSGTSFRQLLDDVRNEHALGYLSSTSFSDSEVAFLLGFEDTNSFYRAFRSWNGMSPSEFRRRSARSA